MQFNKTHAGGEKVKSMSRRLKNFAKSDNSYQEYIDQSIKSENLRFNLSLVISHIIINLHFIDRTPEVFGRIIDEYNTKHGTALSFDDFESIYWVRILSGNIKIPSVVKSFLWKIGHDEKEGKHVGFPEGKEHLARCLQIFYQRCFENSRCTISLEKLNEIIRTKGAPDLSISFFEQREIVNYDNEYNCYNWMGGEYTRHLRKEIAATLWLLIGGENAGDVEFAEYFKRISGAKIWVDNLQGFLTYKNTKRIVELAIAFLKNEPDLLQSKDELQKTWLDSPSYQHIQVGSEVPRVEFKYTSTIDFIENVGYHKWRLHEMFDHQSIRSFCYSLLRIIIKNDPKHPLPYQNVRDLMKDISRPYLVWTLYKEIQREFPEVIPHLLADTEIVPIAYKLIEKIEITQVFLKEQSDNNKRTEEGFFLRQDFWLEMFDLTLHDIACTQPYEKEYGALLAKILLDAAERIFHSNNQNPNQNIQHNALRRKYERAIKKLSTKRSTIGISYPRPQINPRLIFTALPDMATYLSEKDVDPLPARNQFVHLQSGAFDLAIELLRLANVRIPEGELTEAKTEKIKDASNLLVNVLQRRVTEFYTAEDITVATYYDNEDSKRKVGRGVSDFGFEIIDWGYLFLHFEKNKVFEVIYTSFAASLIFDVSGSSHTEQNKEQSEKIRLYLKSIMIAFISINQNKAQYEIEALPVTTALEKLEQQIKDLSFTYSVDAVANRRVDAFDERFRYTYNMYNQPLTSLLYKCVNYFKDPARGAFIESFFANSMNLGRMLTAVNLLDSKDLTAIISKRIEAIPVETFIESSTSTDELQSALIEAVNSDDHLNLVKPLVNRIQEHFKRVKHYEPRTEHLLFEVSLLLAFKEEDYEALIEVPKPKQEYTFSENDKWNTNMQRYFIGLFWIYNDKKYSQGIGMLKSLLSDDTKNIKYAFHLYRAETLNALANNSNLILLTQAHHDWENFANSLSGEEKSGLANFAESLNSNNLHYFAAINDAVRFDQSINKLPKRYFYDEEIIPVVYNYYIARDLHELAFDYIQKAQEHFVNNDMAIPAEIDQILSGSESVKLLSKYRLSLERISSLSPQNIPGITPEIINDKRRLETFILNELIQAVRVVDEKREALRQVTHENRYNDFLQAILRLRFPLWGWSIQDQGRMGTSTGGADAGNADMVVEAGGNRIALVEAFILRDRAYTQMHILKCKKYIGSLTRYYVVVYYLGDPVDFEDKWTTYKDDVLGITYPLDFSIDPTIGFEDISAQFDNVNNFKIAKTVHNKTNDMFHVMINLR
jgi:hypothetical protein